jgi:hypothetical protein
MSDNIADQQITARTAPGTLHVTIERYKSNGWTVKYGSVVMINADEPGLEVTLIDEGTTT